MTHGLVHTGRTPDEIQIHIPRLPRRRRKNGEDEKGPANQRWLAVRTHHRKIKGGKSFSSSYRSSLLLWCHDTHSTLALGQSIKLAIVILPSQWYSQFIIKRENTKKILKRLKYFAFCLPFSLFWNPSTHENMDVDFILNKIGIKGCFPVGIYFYTLFMVCTYCWQMMAHDYGKWTPEFTCAVSHQVLFSLFSLPYSLPTGTKPFNH